MDARGARILADLAYVAAERRRRGATPGLADAVAAIKRYQHRRLDRTYADLLADPAHAAAARFFLDELYGPVDFSRRDAQFERIVPAIVRLFGGEIVDAVAALARLHALTEELDSAMGEASAHRVTGPADYRLAWQRVGRPADRQRQIELMLAIGRRLVRLTGSTLVRGTLKLMRGPAAAAGLGDLQGFLERGFDTFGALPDAGQFLALIDERESRLVQRLFAEEPDSLGKFAENLPPDEEVDK